jgi:signal transduction histidine kinase
LDTAFNFQETLKQYKDFYSEESLPEGSFYGIADHAGLRLFRIPIPDQVFDLGKPISPSVWNLLQTGHKNGVIHQDGSDKVRRIIAYRKLDLGPGTPPYMYMFVGIPEKILAQKASSTMFTNAMLACFSWLFALLLAWLVGRNLFFEKIKKLTDSASQFGAGHLNISTGIDHQAGELGRVAEAFDRMADKLRRANQERDNLQEQLIQSQKLESVGRLAGGVAHDFNNMLMVIIGHAEMLLEQISDQDPNRSSLENIHNAANKSANLTRQLMAFARKQIISPVVLDLNNTIVGMITMLQRLIGENIQVIWIPNKAVWPIKVDPAQLDQILANLAVNARDAIENAGNITIETANVTIDATYCADHLEGAPGDYVMLSVCDDGSGIDKETQARLFEPFFTTKGLGKGTGLGLATIYGIVKQNNGFINVYSELGQGTCFKIYFPRYIGEMPKGEEALRTEIPKGHGELILLVEDEISILSLGKSMLERLGYQVIAATTPDEMLSKLTSLPCPARLLITDVVMPKMNGRELADRIIKMHPEIKCLFMSGYTSNIIAHQGVLDEDANFIEKPFSLKGLATTVRKVLDSH